MFCQKSKWPCFSHTRVTQLQPRITPSCGRPTTRREAKPLQYHPFYRYRPTEPGDDAANIRVGTRFAKNVQKLGQHLIQYFFTVLLVVLVLASTVQYLYKKQLVSCFFRFIFHISVNFIFYTSSTISVSAVFIIFILSDFSASD